MAVTVMDWKVTQAIVENNTAAFRNLVQQDEQVLKRRIRNTTVLHLASRIGNEEMVSHILELNPQMVAAENSNSETPIHEACRMGHDRVVKLLMEKNEWVASNLNCDNQSALFLACSYGHLNIVDFLLVHTSWLLKILDDEACLHVAASKGRTDIAKRLIEKCPDLAQKKDINGCLALHCACRRGQLEISTMLLRMDPDQALQFDNNGYTPLHLAAINGSLAILEEFASTDPLSFQLLSKHGDSVFHLTLRFNKFDAFKFVDGVLKGTDLFYHPDKFGNTLQHLAQIGGYHEFAEYIISETKEQINHQKDILDQTELPTTATKAINHIHVNESHVEAAPLEDEIHSFVELDINRNISFGSQTTGQEQQVQAQKNHPKREHLELHRGTTKCKKHNYTSCHLDSNCHIHSWYEPSWWCLPGRTSKREVNHGQKSSFKIFAISNHIALFVSLCVVLVLVSIIPFRRRPLKLILAAAHKVTWVALSFMAVSYVAASWVIMPMPHESHRVNWIFEALLSICAGTLGFTLFGLGVMFIRHRLKKCKWRKQRQQLMKVKEALEMNLHTLSLHKFRYSWLSNQRTSFPFPSNHP